MAINKAKKDQLVAQYVDLLQRTNGFVIVQQRSMSVKEVDQLRAKVRDASGQYMVAKNTLLVKALESLDWPVPGDLLKGPTAIAFGLENFPGVAKAVLEFLGEGDRVQKMQVGGGVMTGEILNPAKVEAISKLPSLDELHAQLAGLIVAPATGLVSVIHAANSQVVNVIQAYLDDRGGSGEGGEAA